MIPAIRRWLRSDVNTLDQLAGITGVGWTVSILGYVSAILGHEIAVISRFVAGPESLLYLGAALFLATVGLDRLRDRCSEQPAVGGP